MKQILPHIHRGSDTSHEARLPVSPGLEDLGDRISFMGVEVAKGKGGPLTPEAKRFARDVVTEWDLKLMQKLAVGFDPVPGLLKNSQLNC